MSAIQSIILLIVLGFLAIIIALNLWHRHHLQRLSPEERKKAQAPDPERDAW